jgi:uncharacterized protein (TIGR00730 family)
MNNLKNIAIFCGSSRGRNPLYGEEAIKLSKYLVINDMTMINGGGSIGLMGMMTDAAIKNGGKSIGVITLHLKDLEVAHQGMTEMIVTYDMAARLNVIMDMADAYITIPGGFGTMDELFEVLTLSQLNIHDNPVGILNINGFFDPVLRMIDKMVEEGYVSDYSRSLLLVDNNIESLFEQMKNFKKSGFSVQKIIDQKTEKVG